MHTLAYAPPRIGPARVPSADARYLRPRQTPNFGRVCANSADDSQGSKRYVERVCEGTDIIDPPLTEELRILPRTLSRYERVLSTIMRGLIAVGALLSAGGISGVVAAAIQKSSLVLPPSAASHQQTVKNIFLESFTAYKLVHISSY